MIVGMEAETKADNEAIKYARTVLKYTAQKKSFIKEKLGNKYKAWKTLAESEIKMCHSKEVISIIQNMENACIVNRWAALNSLF